MFWLFAVINRLDYHVSHGMPLHILLTNRGHIVISTDTRAVQLCSTRREVLKKCYRMVEWKNLHILLLRWKLMLVSSSMGNKKLPVPSVLKEKRTGRHE